MPARIKKRNPALDYLIIAVLAAVMALNYQVFILSNQFAPAGLNGIATIIQYVFHFSLGYMSLLINIPLALIASTRVNRDFVLKTAVKAVPAAWIMSPP